MYSKYLIVIPTYNEVSNIGELLNNLKNSFKEVSILIVDDNSPDGTSEEVIKFQKKYKDIFLISRESKQGLGTAYIKGFEWALKLDYDYIIQMDADFSHKVSDLKKMLNHSEKSTLVIGSRYVEGGSTKGWTKSRVLLSKIANLLANYVLKINVKDLTGGFKVWPKKILESISFDKIELNGYSFQIEMNFLTSKAGFKILEVPINFIERANGKSKLSNSVVLEAIFYLIKNLNSKHETK